MSLKELQSLVRSRGLAVEKGAKKSALISVLRRSDESPAFLSVLSSTSSSSFLETSLPISDDIENEHVSE
jgi:hypothetical protein